MVIQDNFRLITNAAAAETSQVAPNPQGDVCALTISGDFTEAEIVFEGRGNADADFFPLGGINLADFSRVEGSYKKAGMYEIDVIGVRQMRARLINVTGGTVSVFIQLISTSEI